MAGDARICVGLIAGAHGVRGLVKLKSFTEDPAAVAAYGPLSDETGARRFRIALGSAARDHWIARIDGIGDRDAAEALKGTRLYVDRARLPEPEPESFYHADLIGLRAETGAGAGLGRVTAVHDFGAGDMLEIALGSGRTVVVPFTRAVVPVVEIAAGRVVVDPPEGWLDEPGPAPAGEAEP
jgi:16S rRNA processing protein RimM